MLRRFMFATAISAALCSASWADYLIIRINMSGDVEITGSGATSSRNTSGTGGGVGRGAGAGGNKNSGLPGAGGGSGPSGFGIGDPGTGPGQGPGAGGTPGRGGRAGGAAGGGPSGLGIGDPTQNQSPAAGTEGEQPQLAAKGDLFIAALEVSIANPKAARPLLSHKFGATMIDPNVSIPGFATLQLIKSKSLFDGQFPDKKKNCTDNKKYLDFAEWMIQHWNLPREGKTAMQTRFEEYLDELNGVLSTLSASEQEKVKALRKVRDEMKASWSEPKAELALLKSMPKIGADFKQKVSKHFVVLHPPRDEKQATAKVEKMETALSALMYWYALKGKPLNLPKQQFVCVLSEDDKSFETIHKLFDEMSLNNSDGFYSPVDNIMVLAPTRVDAPFKRFASIANSAETSMEAAYKLKLHNFFSDSTANPKISSNDLTTDKGAELTKGQILALAKFAALEEGEAVAITYQVYQQVMNAAGIFPRQVFFPRSVNQGLSDFFSADKSSGDLNLPVLGTGIGGVHWVHNPFYRKLKDAREKRDGSFTVDEKASRKVKIGKLNVLDIITDRQLDVAEKADAKDKDFWMAKAKSESWALFYFLSNRELDRLQKFLGELGQMPRDLDLSPEVIEQAFGRAFDILDGAGQIDQAKLTKLEGEFKSFMDTVLTDVDTKEVHVKPPENNPNNPPGGQPPKNPGNPGRGGRGPGGIG